MTIDDFLRKCEKIESKATEGPWAKACATSGHSIVRNEIDEKLAACGPSHSEADEEPYQRVINDAEFISFARNTYPILLKMLRVAILGYQALAKPILNGEYPVGDERFALAKLEQLEILAKECE